MIRMNKPSVDNPLASAVARAHAVYEIPDDDLVSEVLLPAMQAADTVDIAVGFFTSQCISQIAPGLVWLIDRDVRCRLLISPELSDEDRDAIDRGVKSVEDTVDAFMLNLLDRADADTIAAHAADCLAFLVAARNAGHSMRPHGTRNVPQEGRGPWRRTASGLPSTVRET